jgi:predicted DNA binding CopG/RHH family protein
VNLPTATPLVEKYKNLETSLLRMRKDNEITEEEDDQITDLLEAWWWILSEEDQASIKEHAAKSQSQSLRTLES